MNLNFRSVLGFGIVVAAVAGMLLTHSLIASSPSLAAIQLLAFLLMVWARITFGRRSFHATADPTEGELVTTGPYRFIRHPIYAAILLFIWAGAADHASFIAFLFTIGGTIGSLLRLLSEEKLLLIRYPEYAEYKARTKRIIPYVY